MIVCTEIYFSWLAALIFFAYGGYNASANLAEEVGTLIGWNPQVQPHILDIELIERYKAAALLLVCCSRGVVGCFLAIAISAMGHAILRLIDRIGNDGRRGDIASLPCRL